MSVNTLHKGDDDDNNNNNNIVMIDKNVKELYVTAAATTNSHNQYSTITDRLQKYTELKEELRRTQRGN